MTVNTQSFSLIIFVMCWCAATCHAQQREISFATGWKQASVTIYDSPVPSDRIPGFLDFQWSGETIGVAEGTITVPEDAFVGVKINCVEGYEDFLPKLPNDGIQRIELVNAELTNLMFEHIERVKSLREVILVNCTASNVDEALLNGLPLMQSLHCRLGNNSAETHRVIAAWAAKSPQLQYYYDGEPLSPEEIRRFAGHKAPLFCTVAFDRDAVTVIDALAAIPNLAGLNVYVSANVPEGYHRSLEKLKDLRVANWSGGKLDKDFLGSIAKIKNFFTFRVQGDAQVSDSFIENVAMLESIEEISFNCRLSDYQRQILPNIVLSMDNIRELPELVDLSAEQMAKLSARTAIRTLSISGLSDQGLLKQLAEFIERNKKLTSLELTNIEWTEEIAKAICSCENLTYLSLDVKDFDGMLLPNVERMRKLGSLYLSIRGRAAGLSVLSQFPSLEEITVSLDTFDANVWSFVANSKSLRSLHVNSGYCDDRIVNWIKQNKSLRSFSTNQCGVMTDAGVFELSQCEHLNSLVIEGFISKRAISTLNLLPKLRSLSVRTDLLSDEDKQNLQSEFSHLEDFALSDFDPLTGKMAIGEDQIYRQVPDDGRDKLDAIEGTSLDEMLGDFLTADLKKQLEGKVVLVEFWGTWCGPCLAFLSELQRLREEFGQRGFEILAIHSETGSETAEAYLKKNPKPWLNLVDKDGKLEESFVVQLFPSTYIFDAKGKLRVALPHRQTLGHSLNLVFKNSR